MAKKGKAAKAGSPRAAAEAAAPPPPRPGSAVGSGLLKFVRVMAVVGIVCGLAMGHLVQWDLDAFAAGLQALYDADMYEATVAENPLLNVRRRTPAQAQMHARELHAQEDSTKKRVGVVMNNDMSAAEQWLLNHAAADPRAAPSTPSCTTADGRAIGEYFYCDGVCDCCDGEDEAACPHVPPHAAPKCKKRCDRHKFKRHWQLKDHEIDDQIKRLEVREGVLQASGLPWEMLVAHQQRLRGDIDAEVKKLKAAAEAQGGLTMEQHQIWQMLQQQMLIQRPILEMTPEQVGPDLMLMPLIQQCASWRGNERYYKGGCARSDAKDANFTVCLFDKAIQQEIPDPEFNDDGTPAAMPEPVVLGLFMGWDSQLMTAVHGNDAAPRRVMVYGGGQPCSVGDKVLERRVRVELVCGDANEITNVFENGVCNYEVVFATPMVCTHTELYKLQEELRVLNESDKYTVHG